LLREVAGAAVRPLPVQNPGEGVRALHRKGPNDRSRKNALERLNEAVRQSVQSPG